MKTVPLTNSSKKALVDDEDFARVQRIEWALHKKGYVIESRQPQRLRLHNFVMGTPPIGKLWDHKFGNKLDNRKLNLRAATPAQNSQNRKRHRNNTSGFKGVYWKKDRLRWFALIVVERERKHLGYFGSRIAAAKAYDSAARTFYGEFCRLNFPDRRDSHR